MSGFPGKLVGYLMAASRWLVSDILEHLYAILLAVGALYAVYWPEKLYMKALLGFGWVAVNVLGIVWYWRWQDRRSPSEEDE